MDKPLFALQSDLDMLAEQVQQLYSGFTKLDWIIQRIKRLDEELTCQGEQMRRMEKQMQRIEERMQLMEKEIAKISILETNMKVLETNMDKIMVHLKIK